MLCSLFFRFFVLTCTVSDYKNVGCEFDSHSKGCITLFRRLMCNVSKIERKVGNGGLELGSLFLPYVGYSVNSQYVGSVLTREYDYIYHLSLL